MLQRIQSLYIFCAIILVGILPFVFPLWKIANIDFYFMKNQMFTVIFGLMVMLLVLSFISFKKRQNQFVLNRLTIILNLILLGLFVYRSLNLSGEVDAISEKGIGMFLPVGAIVMLVLANKAIKKDEDLVKSVDRLR